MFKKKKIVHLFLLLNIIPCYGCITVCESWMKKLHCIIFLHRGWGKNFKYCQSNVRIHFLYIGEIFELNILICNFFSLIGIFAIEISDTRKDSSHPWERSKLQTDFFFCYMIAFIFWMLDNVKCIYYLCASESLFSCAILQWSEMTYKNKNAYGSFYPCSNSECKICLLHYWTLLC